MKVAILAGGLGTRLTEETETKPKPMAEIGGRPILWHIMQTYAHYGVCNIIELTSRSAVKGPWSSSTTRSSAMTSETPGYNRSRAGSCGRSRSTLATRGRSGSQSIRSSKPASSERPATGYGRGSGPLWE
jgi:CTP:molybdopterin cytidylyltransferase MocA